MNCNVQKCKVYYNKIGQFDIAEGAGIIETGKLFSALQRKGCEIQNEK